MMTQIMKKHLKKKKGFTLIEVVVVLVIIAILAAIAIPALTGYIDDANQRRVTTEARTALVGLQHMASTDYADNGVYPQKDDGKSYFGSGGGLTTKGINKINDLTGETIASNISAITFDTSVSTTSSTKVSGFKYTGDGYNVTYSYTNGSGKFGKPAKN